MKKIMIAILMIVLSATLLCITPEVVVAKNCGGVEIADEAHCPDEIDDERDMKNVVSNVLNTIFGIMGVIAVVVIIIGGITYMTSMGDPGKVATAKKAILYAIIGLVVSLSAFAITNFVLGALQ